MRVSRLLTTAVVVGFLALATGCTQPPPPVSDKVAQYYSHPPTSPVVRAKQVAIIGDSYTTGSAMGGNRDANWVALIQKTMNGAADLTSKGIGGTGYTTPGDNFPSRVPMAVAPATDVVVFFGSRNDLAANAESVGKAAASSYAQARVVAPQSKLLVIGPTWVNRDVPANLLLIRDQLKAAATAAGATFVDPLSERWFFDNPELIGQDGVHPTDQGHAYLAGKLKPAIDAALASVK